MLRKIWKKYVKEEKDPRLTQHELDYKELRSGARKRISTINNEFRHTFKFLQSYQHSVTFFGSARFTEDHPYYVRARNLAGKIARETGYAVVSGGGGGIMEAANRGAYEAGGQSLGMNIILPHEQKMNQYLTAHIRFYYFFIRKVALSFSAEVYIFFPGGFGTMDEFYEIITLIQTNKIPRVPVVCVGKEYWSHIQEFSKYLKNDLKVISPEDEKIYQVTDDDEEIIEIIKQSKLRNE